MFLCRCSNNNVLLNYFQITLDEIMNEGDHDTWLLQYRSTT